MRSSESPTLRTTDPTRPPAGAESTSSGLRVAIVTESFLPQVNGVTNSVCRVVDHLGARGHQVLIVAPGQGPTHYAGFPVLRLPGVSLPVYQSFTMGLPTQRLLTAALRAFQPDVIHLASPAVVGAATVQVAQRWGWPTVAVFQTDVVGLVQHYGIPAGQRLWSLLRRVHAGADRTLAPSSSTMGQLRDQGIPRIELWGRGVDCQRFHPEHRDAALRGRLSPEGKPLIGYVGRVAREKRVMWLAHLARLRGGKLVVVGDGPQLSRLRQRLPQAVFTGQQCGQTLSRLYASFDVFVHTGAEETFCQTVQEALVSGVPVVAPAAGGPLDLVRPQQNGLLYAPDSAREFRFSVGRLLRNHELRHRLAARARASAQHRTWEVVNDQLLDHYHAVIAASSQPGRTREVGATAGGSGGEAAVRVRRGAGRPVGDRDRARLRVVARA